jgi:hypothetical protein
MADVVGRNVPRLLGQADGCGENQNEEQRGDSHARLLRAHDRSREPTPSEKWPDRTTSPRRAAARRLFAFVSGGQTPSCSARDPSISG